MPENIHNYLSDMLGAARSKSGDELLVFSIEQVLKAAKPNQAEVLRRCAVPRWVDAGVLRALLQDLETRKPAEELLDLLRSYSFVRELDDGRLAYHDQVRQALLDEWRRERPEAMQALHRQLYRYFNERTTPPGSNRRAMPLMPDSTTLSAVPMSAQADLFRREAIYHLLHADQERGMEELRAAFRELADGHRLADAETLLQVAGEAPLDPSRRRWMDYLQACALQIALNLDKAAEKLETLRALPDLAPDLAAEVDRSLGSVYAETGRWSRATELFRASLAYFQATGNRRAVAETMLLLGEAYQGLGISTGSWQVSTPHPQLRVLQLFWLWLLGLPFRLISLALGPRNRLLPQPEHCARYQNWLLIRLYNTARHWYTQARAAFRDLGDPVGTMRSEQRLADILLLYGYHEEARAHLEALRKSPEARNPYLRAWIDRSLAECHLAAGDVGSAQLLLTDALKFFEDLGDMRRAAVILMLQGRAALEAGDVEGALASYKNSLNRFRELRYAAARERILHDLRTWQRSPRISPALRERLAALVEAEPEKRYVGRFIRSSLPILQVVTILALPLAMLLLALFVPQTGLREGPGGILTINTDYDPLRTLAVLATLIPLYMLVYGALGVLVIFLLPISAIEREQPDVIITRLDGISRYNSKGFLALSMPWAEVRRWIALDRCLWERPLPLYSHTFLEDAAGRDLEIDGITGWYSELQDDIGRRLATVGAQVKRIDLGYRLLKSKSGASAVIGTLLVFLFTAFENDWLPLPAWFPSDIYALVAYFSFSGVLLLVPLAYWIANRPLKLQRALLLNDRWPLILALLGGGAVGAYLISGGKAIPEIDALNYSIFIWGAYILAEALVAMLIPERRRLRLFLVGATVILAVAVSALPAYGSYQWFVAYTAKGQVGGAPTAPAQAAETAASCDLAAEQARALGADIFSTYLFQGDCAVGEAHALTDRGDLNGAARKWREAAGHYNNALNAATTPSQQVLALYNIEQAAQNAGDRNTADSAQGLYRRLCAGPAQGQAICAQIFGRQ